MKTVKLFISSPGDLIPERQLCKQILHNLQKRFESSLHLDIFFWEDEPVLASHTFQTQFPRAADSDIFICLLWSRIGTPLPKGAVFSDGKPVLRQDGSEYESGTIAEFEDALQAFQQHKNPAILMYFKRAAVQLDRDDPNFLYKSKQQYAVQLFFKKWFQDKQGRYPRGHSEFKNLTDFSKQFEQHICKLLVKRFLKKSSNNHRLCHSDWQGNPFLGLSSYQAQHRSIYFGRDLAIDDLYSALQQQAQLKHPFVMVLGQSGSGKSSLIQAGILPLLNQLNIPNFTFRPAYSVGSNEKDLWQCFRERLPSQLPANKNKDLPYAVIYIDQFEELFTLEQFNHKCRLYFFAALNKLVHQGKIWLLASMRSEFLSELSEYPRLSMLLNGQGRYLLLAPTPSDIYRIITEPAISAGLIFEKSANKKPLNQMIFDAIANQPHSLALLSFTLSELYQYREDNHLLSYAAYAHIGGLQGALSRYADNVYADLNLEQRQLLRDFIRILIKVNPEQKQNYSARAIPIEQLAQHAKQQKLLQQLINARLFSSEQTPQGQTIIRVTHEALLNHWGLLDSWLETDKEHLLIRDRINDAATLWQQAYQHSELLLPAGKPLAEALELRKHWGEILSANDLEYIKKSEQIQKDKTERKIKIAETKLRRSRQITTIFALFNILLFSIAYIAYEQNKAAQLSQQKSMKQTKIAQQQRDIAEQAQYTTERTQALFLANLAKQANHKGDYTLASLLALEGLPSNHNNQHRAIVPELAQQLYQAQSLQRAQAQITLKSTPLTIAYHPNKPEIAVGNLQGQIERYHSQTQAHYKKPLFLNDWAITQVSYSPDGKYIAASSEDGLIKVWQTDTAKIQQQLFIKQRINHFSFSADGSEIAIASGDMDNHQARDVYLWHWHNQQSHRLTGHKGSILAVNYSPDGKHLISAGTDKRTILWSLNLRNQEQSLYTHTAPVLHAQFSPDQQRLLTADKEGSWCLWDQHGRLLQQRSVHSDSISSALFSPDSSQFATASWDGQIYLWNSDKGQRLHALRGHENEIYHLSYSANSQQLLSSSNDYSSRLWNTQTGQLISILKAHNNRVYQTIFSPDSQQIASIGGQLWHTTDNQLNFWHQQTPQQHFSRGQVQFKVINAETILLHHRTNGTASIWQTGQKQASLDTNLIDIKMMITDDQAQHLLFIGKNIEQQPEWQHWQQQATQYQLNTNKILANFKTIAISPNQQIFITATNQKQLNIHDSHSAKLLDSIPTPKQSIQQIAISTNNIDFIVTDNIGHIDYYVKGKNGDYQIQQQWLNKEPIQQIKMLDKALIILTNKHLYRYSLNTKQTVQQWNIPAQQQGDSFALSPDKQQLALLTKGKQTLLHIGNWQDEQLLTNVKQLEWQDSQQWSWLDSQHLLNIDTQQHINIWAIETDNNHIQKWQQIKISNTKITQINYHNNLLFALDHSGTIHRYPIYSSFNHLIEKSRKTLLRSLNTEEQQRFFLK